MTKTKKTTKTKTSQGVFVGNYLEPALHRALKAAAKVNDRSLNREVNHRLKLSVATEREQRSLQVAE